MNLNRFAIRSESLGQFGSLTQITIYSKSIEAQPVKKMQVQLYTCK